MSRASSSKPAPTWVSWLVVLGIGVCLVAESFGDRTLGIAAVVGMVLVIPLVIVWIDRSAPLVPPALGVVRRHDGVSEAALGFVERPRRAVATTLALLDLGSFGLAFASGADRPRELVLGLGLALGLPLAASAAWRLRRPRPNGLFLTPTALVHRGTMGDLEVPWGAIRAPRPVRTAWGSPSLVFELHPAASEVDGFHEAGRVARTFGRSKERTVWLGALGAPPDVIIAAVARAIESQDYRAGLGTPSSLGSTANLEPIGPAPLPGTDGAWVRAQAARTGRWFVGFAIVAAIASVVAIANGGEGRLLIIGAAWFIAGIGAPLVSEPGNRYEIVSRIGCRRTALWYAIALAYALVGLAFGLGFVWLAFAAP